MAFRVLPALSLAAGLACLLAACGKDGAPTQPQGRGAAVVPVVTETVREQPWSDSLNALGTVQAREAVTVTAESSPTTATVRVWM